MVRGPAGATFGPVLGLMVFAYITARLILFSTAWAATSTENLAAAPVEPPDVGADHHCGCRNGRDWVCEGRWRRLPWEPLVRLAFRG